ncbi:MAG TPA: LysR family transcriptional regulator [Telluria sp.]|nr:LysR family transcriptional regulator [Telluria sp.]
MDRLDELALLVAIFDEGTLAAAARKMRRSAAAVTRILGEFEARLGVRLVARTTRQLAPTDAGRRLAAHARRILADYEDSMHDAMGDAREPVGVLRISAPLMFGRLHVAPVLAGFLAKHVGVSAELSLSNRMLDLIEHGIDIAVRIGDLDDSQLCARKVGQVRRIVVASPAYLARNGTPATPEQLNGHTLILQSNDGNAVEWRFHIPQTGWLKVNPRSRLVVNQSETAIDLACAGAGLIRALSYQVADQLDSGALVRVLQTFEPPSLPVNLVFSSRDHMPLRIRAFLEIATTALRGSATRWSSERDASSDSG